MWPSATWRNRLATFDLKEYARRGAEARVAELRAEIEAIYRAFPDLRSRGGAGKAKATAGRAEPAAAAPRRRRAMSAAQRKAVSARMKKYWAARRNTAAKK
jgi:hypothetical protein